MRKSKKMTTKSAPMKQIATGVSAPKPRDAKPSRAKTSAGKLGAKLSGLDAAAKVLAEKREPMNCQNIVKAMIAKSYWSTKGKTPAATLYSAIIREIKSKGKQSRFRKTARGMFAASS